MRNLSLPVVWEDADTPEEWERDASMVPDAYSAGRYVYWAWSSGKLEKVVMPFDGNASTWPGLINKTNLVRPVDGSVWNTEVVPPPSLGMLFRDPSTYELFKQGNTPFRLHMESAKLLPTPTWPAMVYGTLPASWGYHSSVEGPLLPNLKVM